MLRKLLLSAILAGAMLVTLSSFGPAAHAQEAEPHTAGDSAESHYQGAVRLFGEGRYVEALQEFDKAIAISPESIFYCNRAVVLIKLGEPLEALRSLETCQNTFTGADAELAEIDAQRLGVERMVHNVRAGALATVDAINTPLAVEPAPQGSGWTKASTGYVLLGVGGALLASAVTLDRLSVDIKDRFVEEARGRVDGTEEAYLEARAAYVQRQRIWLGLAAGGAAVTLVGSSLVALHFLGGNEGADVSALVTPGGVSLRWVW